MLAFPTPPARVCTHLDCWTGKRPAVFARTHIRQLERAIRVRSMAFLGKRVVVGAIICNALLNRKGLPGGTGYGKGGEQPNNGVDCATG